MSAKLTPADVLRLLGGLAEPEPEQTRRFFSLPWGGGVDLDAIVSVTPDKGQVVIQLRGDGYIRSPFLTEARPLADAIFEAASEGAYVYGGGQ